MNDFGRIPGPRERRLALLHLGELKDFVSKQRVWAPRDNAFLPYAMNLARSHFSLLYFFNRSYPHVLLDKRSTTSTMVGKLEIGQIANE